MCKQNISHWINQITNSSRQGKHKQTIILFYQMQSQNVPLCPYVIPTILKSCSNPSSSKLGKAIHAHIIRSCVHIDPFITSALIDFYYKCNKLHTARNLFDTIRERDLVVWNSMISAYTHFGFAFHALVLSIKMQSFGLNPDLYTWNALIFGFSQTSNHEMASNLFTSMRLEGVTPDVFSWTSIVSGLVKNFKYNEAFDTFRNMVKVAKLKPSSFTISSILPACANITNVKRGKEIHGYSISTRLEKDTFVSSALIDMYAKCGHIYEAEKVFDKMEERTSVSWNSMIFANSNHGYCTKAISLFYLMKDECITPDHLTFTAVFTACSHSGMVELGKSLFDSMQNEHGIKPRLEHYACMVDMLGRAGMVMEAYEFIKKMNVKPDAFVWGALLGACRKHGNFEIGEIAAFCLEEMEPKSSGSRILLSNILKDNEMWNEGLIKDGLKKKKRRLRYSGHSWIQDACS